MKKILATLSLFLLTNVSLANTFGTLESSIKKINLGSYFSIVFFVIFIIIFSISVMRIMKSCQSMMLSENVEEKKKLTKKSLTFSINSLLFLLVGSIVLSVLFSTMTGSARVPNYIDFVFDILSWTTFIGIIILGIITELIKRNKINSSKLVNIISILSIVIVSILSIILIIGLIKGDYYKTTYYWG